MKTSELQGAALDWAVAMCEGFVQQGDEPWEPGEEPFGFATDWSQGGPIIEREEIELHKWAIDGWKAQATNYSFLNTPQECDTFAEVYGPTPLIAAMRCYVASKLGDTVYVPAELE